MSTHVHPFANAKDAVLKVLRARGVATVEIAYDGEGDEGQIGDIVAYDAKGAQTEARLTKPAKLTLRADEKPTRFGSLHDALGDFAWSVLDHYHGGFQNTDGGFGTITLDVANGSVTIDHNDRIAEVLNTVTEA